jgi:hypothetical protein
MNWPFHTHRWQDTAWNPFQVAHEQRCACGAYRHRFFDEKLNAGSWVGGQHPKVRALRANPGTPSAAPAEPQPPQP